MVLASMNAITFFNVDSVRLTKLCTTLAGWYFCWDWSLLHTHTL